MPKRKSKTEKILGVLYAAAQDAADELSAMMSYSELRRRVWGMRDKPSELSKAIYSLKEYGYLEIVEKDNKKAVRLTDKGKLRVWSPQINQKWDGRWRLVAFDISEKTKRKRDGFRSALKAMGFRQMQKSLWICPYDVSESIEEVIDMLDIENEVDYFIADAITNKEKFVDIFNLHHK